MTLNELNHAHERRSVQAEAEAQAEVDAFMSRHGLVPFSAQKDTDPEPTHVVTAPAPEHQPTPPEPKIEEETRCYEQ